MEYDGQRLLDVINDPNALENFLGSNGTGSGINLESTAITQQQLVSLQQQIQQQQQLQQLQQLQFQQQNQEQQQQQQQQQQQHLHHQVRLWTVILSDINSSGK